MNKYLGNQLDRSVVYQQLKEKCEKNTICLAGNHKISYNS